ncbi:MAG: signal recognition particle protein [Actinobacteria bacterium]|nr:signal recognition particle protein [Actinomycetota bacterium]
MFDTLSDRFEGIFARLRSRGHLTDAVVGEALSEIRTALLEADVEIGVARAFVERVRARCVGIELSKSLTPAQQVVKAVNEELVSVLGGETLRISYASRPPTVVLLAGLQGAGKTTAAAKLGRWFRQQGRNPLLVAADLQRPAAVEQLRILGAQAGVQVVSADDFQSESADLARPALGPVETARLGVDEARRRGRDVVVIDTAGRLAVDAELMDEIRAVSAATQPDYTFFVIDAMTGQDAVGTAESFHEALELDGIIMTKLDGDARGGAALSVKEVVGRPIAFASTGEKLEDFDAFHPDRMADRILGMGDVLSLVEKAERELDLDVATRGATRIQEGTFTLEDFLEQMQQVKRMGPIAGLLGMLPGVPKEVKNAEIGDGEIARVEAIIQSMTPAERRNPVIIDGSRRVRIAQGAGCTTSDVNNLLRQFKEMQRVMRSFTGGGRKGGKKAKRGRATAGMPDLGELLK